MAQPVQGGSSSASENDGGFNPELKFVRINEVREDGFVVFDFAIGEPDLFVELLLTQAAFAEFCDAQKVIFLGKPVDRQPASDLDWRLRDAVSNRIAGRDDRSRR